MYLEEVNIEGFKSFSEPTSMGFQTGIGVIMGNNGVGKSNILDAIVWCLGEDRLDRIRCYEPEEIFFAGSNAHLPAQKASVELIFKLGREKNDPKLVVSRAITRMGENRYRIGGNEYARDDYIEQLSVHRLGDALKTIIRQEEINDLIQLDPQNRFKSLESLIGRNGAKPLSEVIQESVAPLFYRYMGHLVPLAEVALQTRAPSGADVLDVVVTLPGNRIRRAHQLSGGEKSITSLALRLSVFDLLDSPFFLLDEVEPALDYVNHKSMQRFLKDVAQNKQLIMITHLRSTIELADTLHGVRTRFDGSSFMKFYFVMDERLLRLYKCC